MSDNKEKKQKEKNIFNAYQVLVCENCLGKGKTEKGKCPNCNGLGIGFWLQGIFYFWNKKINSLTILERKIEKLARRIVNGFLFFFGIFGILFYLYYIYKSGGVERLFEKDFWLYQDSQTLFFWLSLLAWMYLIYRLDKESSLKERIRKKKYNNNFDFDKISWSDIKNIPDNAKIDVSKAFNEKSISVIEDAWELAKKFDHRKVMPIHLLATLLFSSKINLIFARLGVNVENIASKVSRFLNKQESFEFENDDKISFSQKTKEVFFKAYLTAYDVREAQVNVIDLLLAVADTDSNAKEILYDFDIDFKKLKNVVQWIRVNEKLRDRSRNFRKKAFFKPKGTLDRAMTAAATPTLDRFSRDLTLMAKFGYLDLCVGRDAEISEIFRVIEANGQSVLLIGNPGVGKRTIIEGIAMLMVAEEVPKIIQDKRLVALSVARLISGVDPFEAEGRLMRIIDEIRRSGNVVLFIEDIEDMMGISSGGEESMDLASVLVSEISKGTFFTFATATSINYTRYLENSSLDDVMQNIKISEPEKNSAIQILESKTALIEYKNQVFFSYGAIEEAVVLSDRYIHDKYLPEKAIQIIEQVALYVKKRKGPKSIVLGEDVARLISEKTEIPLSSVTEEEGEKLLRLEEEIHKRIIGQDEAVKMISAALRRARANLRDTRRPIANFLFLGPTGVGKTELSKTVADVYFSGEDDMVRIDMSEYQEQSSIYRLIGTPPSGGGLGHGGYLTEAVRKNPFTLVLLDEIEKAHKDILNVFLQVMDDGRLTDGLGRTIDFTNVILVATSNAGTDFIQEKIQAGWAIEKIKAELLNNELKNYFAPEFLNRFDGVIVFKPLKFKEVIQITRLLLGKIAEQMEEKGVILKVTDEAIKDLAKQGFDPKFGARPLRRVLQEKVSDYLANYLLKKKIGRRDLVVLDKDGIIKIEKAKEF